jgi:hypothetical protein
MDYLSSISVYSQQFAICTYTYPAYLNMANNSLYVPIPIQHICIRPTILYMYLYLSSISVNSQQFSICTYTYPAYLYTANNLLYVPIPIQHICIWPTRDDRNYSCGHQLYPSKIEWNGSDMLVIIQLC